MWSAACARAPRGSAGPRATRGPGCAATATGWSVPAWPPRSTRPTGCPFDGDDPLEGGRYDIEIGAADLGTGTWTTLPQIAADALGVDVEDVEVRIGDTDYPMASVAGGSSGMTTWGSAVVEAARAFRDKYGTDPADGDEATAVGPPDDRYAMHAFGAQFAEAHVHADTGEVRVPRLLGVFAAGRIINPRTARSQFIGGMTMGLSMALHEKSVLDPRFGHVVNHDFAEYHIAANADVGESRRIGSTSTTRTSTRWGPRGSARSGSWAPRRRCQRGVSRQRSAGRDLPVTLDKVLAQRPSH